MKSCGWVIDHVQEGGGAKIAAAVVGRGQEEAEEDGEGEVSECFRCRYRRHSSPEGDYFINWLQFSVNWCILTIILRIGGWWFMVWDMAIRCTFSEILAKYQQYCSIGTNIIGSSILFFSINGGLIPRIPFIRNQWIKAYILRSLLTRIIHRYIDTTTKCL